MANEFKIKNGIIDLSLAGSKILQTDTNKKYTESTKTFNDTGITINDIWSASKIISYTSSISVGGINTNVQYNNNGVLAGSSYFSFITGTNPYISMIGVLGTNQLRVGGSTDVGNAAVYIETNSSQMDGQRVYFNSGTPATSGYISYAYDGSTPYIRITDVDDDPPYIMFNTVLTGTYAIPAYSNTFGSRGPTAGATTGFSWKANGVEIMTCDSNFLTIPIRPTASRPTILVNGMIGYDSTTNKFEGYENGIWKNLVNLAVDDNATITGSWIFNALHENQKGIRLTGIISPPQITATTNNYNPTGLSTCNIMRLSTDATRTISGIVAQESGRIIVLINTGTANITITNEGASSTAANRFANGGDTTLGTMETMTIWYDETSLRWRAIANTVRQA